MKKFLCLIFVILLTLCGCQGANSSTRFLLNTTVNITLYGKDAQHLDGAFALCEQYENMLSRTKENSDIYKINNSAAAATVSDETVEIINLSRQYYDITKGKFDITVGAVSKLWDFTAGVLPSEQNITSALQKIGYQKLQIDGNKVASNGCVIDLGAIAKGYIADKLKQDLILKGVQKGVLNLGGNITVWGEEYTVGIRKPFSDNEITARVKVNNLTVATSGVYERCFEQNGKSYHHILDAKTGYPAESNLLSATVICADGAAADTLSTVCILMGEQKAIEIIEQTENTEAIFVDKDYNVYATSGLKLKNGVYYLT
ncbi:MAG: FAD:protein FMN transferase [Clostridia bacterium]|nr:FAD:protein FMN transferase [Clostridia bacterium]